MNNISRMILECYRDNGADEAYIVVKRLMLEPLDKAQSLLKIANLDTGNRARLAAKAGITSAQLEITLHVLNKLL